MSLGIRLQKILDQENLTANKLAKNLGMDRADNINNIISGKTQDVKSKLLTQILKEFPKVNARWLLTGKGKMFNEDKSRINSCSETDENDEMSEIENLRELFNQILDEFIELKKENNELKKNTNLSK
jgi:transcriptional regulator with XRE-family HTH domain